MEALARGCSSTSCPCPKSQGAATPPAGSNTQTPPLCHTTRGSSTLHGAQGGSDPCVPLTFSREEQEGSGQQEQRQEDAQSHGELRGVWERGARCCPAPRLLLFISGHFAFIFGPPWQAAHQPAGGWVMEGREGGCFL